MNATIELAARLVGQNFVRLQHGDDADAWQYTMSAHDVASAFSQYQDAEIERLRAALTLAANRMDVLALDHDYGTTRRNIADDWATETRAALGPNVRANLDPAAAQEYANGTK